MNDRRVVLGLSGGVDSAVAALTLVRQGFEVHCVYLDNGLGDPTPAEEISRTFSLSFYVKNIEKPLDSHVCKPFFDGYLKGETPSPCAICNPKVKFPALLETAETLAAQWIATGHYARTQHGLLLKSKSANDQSYLLGRLTREQLKRALFPLGSYEKNEVRAIAEQNGLSVAHKPDSMEICFIPDDNYPAWLENYGKTPPEGDFIDQNGRVLGRHKGIHHYTLGQGRGLGLSGPCKYYVSAILPATNQVVLSDGSDLFTQTVRCRDMNYLAIDALPSPLSLTARFRHSKDETPAVLFPQEDGTVLAQTKTPVRAPTPGQLAVFYDGEVVVASGWIA